MNANIDLIAGTDIKQAARILIERANKTKHLVSTNFNGIILQAQPQSTTINEIKYYYFWQIEEMQKNKIKKALKGFINNVEEIYTLKEITL